MDEDDVGGDDKIAECGNGERTLEVLVESFLRRNTRIALPDLSSGSGYSNGGASPCRLNVGSRGPGREETAMDLSEGVCRPCNKVVISSLRLLYLNHSRKDDSLILNNVIEV